MSYSIISDFMGEYLSQFHIGRQVNKGEKDEKLLPQPRDNNDSSRPCHCCQNMVPIAQDTANELGFLSRLSHEVLMQLIS